MTVFLQGNRPIGIETSLGTDKLILLSFSGEERLSALFRFELRLLSSEARIRPAEIVGKAVSFFVKYPDNEKRYFNGIVNRFAYAGQDDRGHYYSAEVVPWMWLLTKGSDCRVHETEKRKDAKAIIDGLLGELGLTSYKWNVKRTLEKREYCVQFRETHYDFITRLLAEEGIYFYFRHEQGNHDLVMTDHVNGAYDSRDAEVQLLSNLSQPEITDNLTAWQHQYEYTSGKYSLTDYNFETPSTSLLQNRASLIPLNNNAKLEFYDYPGLYGQKGLGESLTTQRMEGEEARHNVVIGGSECRSFSPGGRFKVAKHHNDGEKGGKWMLTSVKHTATLGGSYITGVNHADKIYENEFECLPTDIVYRPDLRPRVGIDGIQSAVVVGPEGEEIYTDKFGRVKVQFPWDRRGKKDDKSSCWIRVSQVHAGKGWGMMDLPRIGEEVLVSFLDGNPDRPVIIGRVYNGDNDPPFSLPREKTRRGNSTKTHKGAGFNEMSMDDTSGEEQLRVNAQYDMNSNVNHDQTLNVGNNQSEKIGVDRSREVGSNEKVSVGSNQNIDIGNSQEVVVGFNQNVQVGVNQSIVVGSKILINAGTSITLKCGASTIHMNQAGVITISGTLVTTAAAINANVVAPITNINGSLLLSQTGLLNTSVGVIKYDEGSMLGHYGGGKAELAASGECLVQGGVVKLN